MKFLRLKSFAFVLSSAALVMVPVERAQANDGLAGFIAGAIIGGALSQGQRQQQQRQQAQQPSPGISQAQREQNRQVQTALNYFGWNVGTVDGALGSRSRAAISQFQASMGFPADGQLDDFERGVLLNGHQRALATQGLPPYNQIYAQQGPQGLLRTFRNEQLGIPTPELQQAAAPAKPPAAIVPPAPTAPAVADAPAAAPSLPSFPSVATVRSLNGHCNSVGVLTTANGGYATAATVTDAGLALNEQFCLGRTFAISEANRLLGAMAGVTPDQVEQQCAGLTTFMQPALAGAATSAPAQVRQQAAVLLQGAGQTQDQLISTGQICLGTGYRIDDADMAFASTVLLAASGRPAFGEFVGHHLREGFGTPADPVRGAVWLREAVADLEAGGVPAVLPGTTADRVAVLRVALEGGSAKAPAAPAAPGLPVFPTLGGN